MEFCVVLNKLEDRGTLRMFASVPAI